MMAMNFLPRRSRKSAEPISLRCRAQRGGGGEAPVEMCRHWVPRRLSLAKTPASSVASPPSPSGRSASPIWPSFAGYFPLRGKNSVALALAVLTSLAFPTHAQTVPSGNAAPAAPRERGQQFDIQAEDGIEWDKDRRTYTARGNVRIVRGDRIVRAPIAVAHYRDREGGKTEIYWVEVEGGVQIGIGDDTATGERGTYDLEKKVFVLTGRNLSYNAQDARVTARDALEYHEEKKFAIARGNAHVAREAEWLKGDVVTAFFEERREPRKQPTTVAPRSTTPGGGQQAAAPAPGDEMATRNKIVRVEGSGNVIVNSCDGVGRGNKFVYFPETGQATLEGNARLTRGLMQMNGERAEMNTRTQYMRLLPGPDGKQVAGTFFTASETFKPDNIPFDASGNDPCKNKPGQANAPAAAPKPAGQSR
jgi:lipopolysaccharide export system protein LptA